MKYKNLHLIKFFFVLILLIISLAVLILGFCWFFYLLPIDFPGTIGEWITGLSALAGGALTLVGVWWTIKDNENKRREDLATQYRPIINISNFTDKIPNYKKYISLNPNKKNTANNNDNIYYAVEFFNIGRGILRNFTIDKIVVEPIDIVQFDYNHEILCHIAPQDQLYLKINLPQSIVLKENIPTFNKMNIIISLKGVDEFNINHFYYILKLELDVNLKKKITQSQITEYIPSYRSMSLNIIELER